MKINMINILQFETHYFLCCLLHNQLLDIYTPKNDKLNELFICTEQSYTKEHCFWVFKYIRERVEDNKKTLFLYQIILLLHIEKI